MTRARIPRPDDGNPGGVQPPADEFARQTDKVCAWCKPMHVMTGPHAGEVVPEHLVRVTKGGATFRSVPESYKGTPCTTGMCPAGERRARGLLYGHETTEGDTP